jgi:hypothetical protein
MQVSVFPAFSVVFVLVFAVFSVVFMLVFPVFGSLRGGLGGLLGN